MLALRLTIVKIATSVAGGEPEQPLGDDVEQPAAGSAASSRDRQRVQIQRVQRDVDDDHRDGAEPERERHVAARIAHLLGDIGRGVPTRVA